MRYVLLIATAAIAMALGAVACGDGDDDDAGGLTGVREAIAQYQTTEQAQAAGWDLQEDLDQCFDKPGVGAMGFHYIDADRLDTVVDPLDPEAIIYAPDANGDMELVAVEYIVPAEDWDAEGNDALPEAHGQSFHLNEELGVYVLHAWLFRENSTGMFEDWNPDVSCP